MNDFYAKKSRFSFFRGLLRSTEFEETKDFRGTIETKVNSENCWFLEFRIKLTIFLRFLEFRIDQIVDFMRNSRYQHFSKFTRVPLVPRIPWTRIFGVKN